MYNNHVFYFYIYYILCCHQSEYFIYNIELKRETGGSQEIKYSENDYVNHGNKMYKNYVQKMYSIFFIKLIQRDKNGSINNKYF